MGEYIDMSHSDRSLKTKLSEKISGIKSNIQSSIRESKDKRERIKSAYNEEKQHQEEIYARVRAREDVDRKYSPPNYLSGKNLNRDPFGSLLFGPAKKKKPSKSRSKVHKSKRFKYIRVRV